MRVSLPVTHDYTLESPFLAEDFLEQEGVLRGMCTVNATIPEQNYKYMIGLWQV